MKNYVFKNLFIVFAVLSLVACGGGGSSSSNNSPEPIQTITPPAQSLFGTYTLSGFEVNYDDGTSFTHEDVASYSGSWVIKEDLTTQQTVELDGVEFAVPSATWTIDGATGLMRIQNTNGIETVLELRFNGNILGTRTQIAPGVLFERGYTEFNLWTKTSDQTTRTATTMSIEEEVGGGVDGEALIPGGLAGQIIELWR